MSQPNGTTDVFNNMPQRTWTRPLTRPAPPRPSPPRPAPPRRPVDRTNGGGDLYVCISALWSVTPAHHEIAAYRLSADSHTAHGQGTAQSSVRIFAIDTTVAAATKEIVALLTRHTYRRPPTDIFLSTLVKLVKKKGIIGVSSDDVGAQLARYCVDMCIDMRLDMRLDMCLDVCATCIYTDAHTCCKHGACM